MEPYVGEIRMFAGNYPPTGWALCDGSLLSINDNELLYNLIGTTYGGDGQTNFAVPDLRGRAPINMGNGYSIGQTGGTETVTLTMTQMPMHNHAAFAAKVDATQNSPTGNLWAGIGSSPYVTTNPSGSTVQMNPAIIGAQGGSQPHDNMMPYLTVSYIIALQGIYPQQS